VGRGKRFPSDDIASGTRIKRHGGFVAASLQYQRNTYLSKQRANRKGGEKLVTSKNRTGSKVGSIALLFSATVMVFTLMFGGSAAADETATTANVGGAGANTGGNGAAGNGSDNEAESEQAAVSAAGGDDAVAPNNSGTGNSSTGSASITTGDANATGNSATNTTDQTVVEGHNGVVSITDQDATIVNAGFAFANTGGNVAVGNASDNDADADQFALGIGGDGDAVATNNADVRNESGGDARIVTGDATATGSTSNNTIRQSNTIDCPDCLGVVVLGDQNATIVNVGIAGANTGGNAAIGNASDNDAESEQFALGFNLGEGDVVAANTAETANSSDGSAEIVTGDATAVGNVATNNVSQITSVNAPNSLGVIVLTDQNALVANVGLSFANTGLNLAVGNASDNETDVDGAVISGAGPPPGGDVVASNDAIATNESDGSASIWSGNANAIGNRSTTNLTQALDVNTNGNAIVLSDQNAFVINFGLGISNTGLNAAVGNASDNDADADQFALALAFDEADDAVAANFGTAENLSDGSASVKTGNASSTGNESTTNVAQTIDANMDGGFVLPDQLALVINAGIGVSNTGLNLAVGNVSENEADVEQFAFTLSEAEDIVASNFGDASNESNGSADITTGNADSVGNSSAATTNVAQVVDTNGAQNVLSDQTALVIDFGVGISNTGLNLAIGNASDNDADLDQDALVIDADGDAVASNFGEAGNESDGDASITTGNASAIGTKSHTNIAQVVNANGADGFVLSDQTAIVANIGIGLANTGLNLAIGNASDNESELEQEAEFLDDSGEEDTVAANFGTAENLSDGSASIHTGNASAVGSRSTTNIAQTVDMNGDGFVLVDQIALGINIGIGIANTGGNAAFGNLSDNDVELDQEAEIAIDDDDNVEDLVASNDGIATNDSDGSADIVTGSAHAIGNDSASTLNIAQTADVNGGGFALVDQIAIAVMIGVAVASTGLNLGIGNASENESDVDQEAELEEDGAGDVNAEDVVASNTAESTNDSDGSARIVTGSASATGNASSTNIAQTSDFNGDGFTLVDQSAFVINVGIAASNTGLNLAIGNASDNDSDVDQEAAIDEDGDGDVDLDGDAVAANTSDSGTDSDGSASITTGSATATGNWSNDTITQTANTNIDGSGFSLNDQNALVLNLGVGVANTGLNAAIGNASDNESDVDQDAEVSEDDAGDLEVDGDVAVVNTSESNVESDGSASITTGAAEATGNKSSTTVNQVADTNISGNGFVLNDQIATVLNIGIGVANSGLNLAIGNASDNDSDVDQDAEVEEDNDGDLDIDGDVVAVNTSDNTLDSDGHASITTGAARAIGNDSAATTVINQVSDTNIAGIGFALVDQEVTVVNLGVGIANSGLNLALGNVSENEIDSDQDADIAEDDAGDLNIAEDAVAVNTSSANNESNGSADITTGDAEGIGNRSTTVVNQVADNELDGGFELVDQSLLVVNAGLGVGNSGLNLAIGNASDNDIDVDNDANITEEGDGDLDLDGDAVASNSQELTNDSDGSASITTGCGAGSGNISTTHAGNGDGAQVFNLGIGIGNSGLNLALGNASDNEIDSDSEAEIAEEDAGDLEIDGDTVAANTVEATNESDGDASVDTGDAFGYGNTSTTIVNGDSLVVNFGIGLANTGLNAAFANLSDNDIDSDTEAEIDEEGAGDLDVDDDGVASNAITEVNDSDGEADVTTGDAYALGNRSATGIVGSEEATTINFGLAFANSGLNIGLGNVSDNEVDHEAEAEAPGGVAVNVADLSNTSDGSATIVTGDANAFGNIASNATCQGVPFGPLCPQPELPPLPPGFKCGCDEKKDVPKSEQPTQPPVNPVPPVLARTGESVEGLAMLGLLLLTIGVFLRRKARTA